MKTYLYICASPIHLIALWLALGGAWWLIAASIPAIRFGRYRGQVVTALDSAGLLAIAFVVLCAPVFALIFGGK